MIYFLVLSVLINLVLFYILFKQVRDSRMLIKLNDSLDAQLTSYKVSQSSLIEKMREMELLSEEQVEELSRVSLLVEERKFLVGAKIKWIDGKGEEELGIVCDDFVSDNKNFVVVRAMKNGKLMGRYFTIKAERLSLV
jgi:regulatory protein YycI of two-component signal transduction system YycFG